MFRYIALFSTALLLMVAPAKAQNELDEDRDWRVEVDPVPFFMNGYSLLISKNISEDNRWNLGIYTTKFDLPRKWNDRYYSNVSTSADVSYFEFGAITRYRFDFTDRESEPYVGITLGYGQADIKQEAFSDIRLTGISMTPHIGYEIYLPGQRVYLNPQLRGTFYIAKDTDAPARSEEVKAFAFTPSIVIGARF
jgi:hypothetical protein